MSNLAATKERKFAKGFNRRFKLISQVPNTKISAEDLLGVEYRFTRNIPANVQEEAQTARTLQGVVSDEMLLETLSIVENAKAEMERIAEETAGSPAYDFERQMTDEG